MNNRKVDFTKSFVGVDGRQVDYGIGRPPGAPAIPVEPEPEPTAPDAPLNVSASEGSTAGSIDLTWDASTDATSYKVYYSETPSSITPLEDGYPASGANVGDTTEVTITGLSYDTTYYFKVKAVNSVGDSAYSDEVSGTTGIIAPAAPTGFYGETGTEPNSVILYWNSSFGATSYEVYYDETRVEAPFAPIENGSPNNGSDIGNVTSVEIISLSPFTEYNFSVKAVNSAGSSDYVTPIQVTSQVSNVDPPEAPTDFTVEQGDRGELIFSWSRMERATSYKIYYDEDPNNPPYIPATAGDVSSGYDVGDVSTYTLTGLPDDTIYRAAVTAINNFGESDYSTEDIAQTYNGLPLAPENLVAVSGDDDGKVVLTWDASTHATSYEIFYDENSFTEPFTPTNDGTPASGTDVGDVTTIEITGLEPGELYYFAVKAVNENGESDLSEYYQTRASVTPPYAPLNFSAESDTQEGTVLLTWSDVGNATGYKIYYGEISGGPPYTPSNDGVPANGSTIGNVTEISISGLTESETYYFKIRGYNNGGDGALTDEISGVARPRVSTPTGFTASPGEDDGEVLLEWTASDYATSYKVYYDDDAPGAPYGGVGGATPASGTDVGNVTSAVISGLTPNTTYYFAVSAIDNLEEPDIESDLTADDSAVAKLNVPLAPTSLTVEQGENNGEIDLVWSSSSGATGYKVYYDDDNTPPYDPSLANEGDDPSGVDVGNVNSYTLTGLTGGLQYYLAVKAYNASGDSDDYSPQQTAVAQDGEASPVTAIAEITHEAWYEGIESADGTPTSAEMPNRYDWMAPFPVFVEGWNSSSTAGEIVSWTWNWGDGSDTNSGMNSAHLYETPGNYTITLTAQDEFGNVNTDTLEITVQARVGTVYYVSESGNDSNNGTSSETAWRSATKVVQMIASNSFSRGDSILFERGGEYTLTTGNCTFNNSTLTPRGGFYLGATGSGAAPIINLVRGSSIWAMDIGWRGFHYFGLMDLDFQGPKNGNNTSVLSVWKDCSHIFINRCNFDDVYQFFTVQSSLEEASWATDQRVCENIFTFNCTSGLNATAMSQAELDAGKFGSRETSLFFYGFRIAVIGNNLNYSNNHINYNSFVERGIWENNEFSYPCWGRHTIRISATTGDFDFPADRIHILNNIFRGCIDQFTTDGDLHVNGRYTTAVVELCPQTYENQSIENLIFENNEVYDGEKLMRLGSLENVVIKGNYFNTIALGTAYPRFDIGMDVLTMRPIDNLKIINNTIISTEAGRGGQGNPIFYIANYDEASYNGLDTHRDIYIENNTITVNGRFKYIMFGPGPVSPNTYSTEAEYLDECKSVWSDNNTLTMPQSVYDAGSGQKQLVRLGGGYQSGGFNKNLTQWDTYSADIAAFGNLPAGKRDENTTLLFS